MLAAIERGAKGYPFVRQLPEARKTEHLIPTTVGEDRATPMHEPVEAAEARDELGAGTKDKMIRVREHNLHANLLDLFRS